MSIRARQPKNELRPLQTQAAAQANLNGTFQTRVNSVEGIQAPSAELRFEDVNHTHSLYWCMYHTP